MQLSVVRFIFVLQHADLSIIVYELRTRQHLLKLCLHDLLRALPAYFRPCETQAMLELAPRQHVLVEHVHQYIQDAFNVVSSRLAGPPTHMHRRKHEVPAILLVKFILLVRLRLFLNIVLKAQAEVN